MSTPSLRKLTVLVVLISIGAIVIVAYSSSNNNLSVQEQRYNRLQKGVALPVWFWMMGDHTDTSHYENFINDSDVQIMQSLGITHIRLPVESSIFTNRYLYEVDPIPYLTIAIQKFIDADIAVIVTPFGDLSDSFRQGDTEYAGILWQELAPYLSQFDPEMLFIQVANEPALPLNTWQALQWELIQIIREYAPYHTIFTATPLGSTNNVDTLLPIDALVQIEPYPDTNLIYSLHFYEPLIFTQQGAEWVDWFSLVSGLPYPSSVDDVAEIAIVTALNIPTDFEWIPFSILHYGEESWNQTKIRNRLAQAINWANSNNVLIHVDEFGVYRDGGVASDDRNRWLHDVRVVLEENHIGWTIWDYSDGFGIVQNLANDRQVDVGAAKALGLNLSGVNSY